MPREESKYRWEWLLAVMLLASSLGYPVEENISPPESWQKTYRGLRDLVEKIDEQVTRNFFPEFTIVKEGSVITTLAVDPFSSRVLTEAEGVISPYREGLQGCIEKHLNEFRPSATQSYEKFAWFLDRYTRLLTQTVGGQEEPTPVNGVREKRVTTDRTLYAYTRLLISYLEERRARYPKQSETSFAADRALETALADIGRRVLHLNLTTPFSAKDTAGEPAPQSTVYRDLATRDLGETYALGLEPLSALGLELGDKPHCEFAIVPRQSRQASAASTRP